MTRFIAFASTLAVLVSSAAAAVPPIGEFQIEEEKLTTKVGARTVYELKIDAVSEVERIQPRTIEPSEITPYLDLNGCLMARQVRDTDQVYVYTLGSKVTFKDSRKAEEFGPGWYDDRLLDELKGMTLQLETYKPSSSDPQDPNGTRTVYRPLQATFFDLPALPQTMGRIRLENKEEMTPMTSSSEGSSPAFLLKGDHLESYRFFPNGILLSHSHPMPAPGYYPVHLGPPLTASDAARARKGLPIHRSNYTTWDFPAPQ